MTLGPMLYRYSKKRSRRNLYAWMREAIVTFHLDKQSDILNIGAGGEVSTVLAQAGVKATSVDVDPARQPDIVAGLEDMRRFSDATAGAIFCIEVLEHVPRPHVAVSEIYRVLRPGGLLVGSTPFLLGIHDGPNDYFRFTRHGLAYLFGAFEPVLMRERNGYFSSVAVLVHRWFVIGGSGRRAVSVLLSPILLICAAMFEAVDRLLPSTAATTGYFFIFRKPLSSSVAR